MGVWERVDSAVGGAWTFLQTDPGLLVIGLAVAFAGLLAVHRTFADSLFRKSAESLLRDILKETEEKLVSMRDERNEARKLYQRASSELQAARPYQLRAEDIERGLAMMERVWLNHEQIDTSSLDVSTEEAREDPEIEAADSEEPTAENGKTLNEESCELVLRRNLWVLYPDFTVEKINRSSRISLSTILREHFPNHAQNKINYKMVLNLRRKPDICGWFHARSVLSPGYSMIDPIYVLIELKNSQEPVRRQWIEQVHAYAYTLMLKVDLLWGKRIECFVIGSEIKPDVNDVQLNWGVGKHDSIRITPLSYRQLYERARWIAVNFLPPPAEGAEDLIEPVFETAPEDAQTDDEPTLELTDIAEPAAPESPAAREPDVEAVTEDNPIVEKHRALQGLLDRFHDRKKEPADPA